MGLDPAQPHELVVRDAHRVPGRSEVLLHQARVEAVVSGRHGRVRGEDRLPGDPADGVVERVAVPFHAAPHRLQGGERRVALVEVIDARDDPHRPDRLHSADPEDQFLANPHAVVTPVEATREQSILG